MSGYSVTEKKITGDKKPKVAVCGSCGEPVAKGRLVCDECVGIRWCNNYYDDEAARG